MALAQDKAVISSIVVDEATSCQQALNSEAQGEDTDKREEEGMICSARSDSGSNYQGYLGQLWLCERGSVQGQGKEVTDGGLLILRKTFQSLYPPHNPTNDMEL